VSVTKIDSPISPFKSTPNACGNVVAGRSLTASARVSIELLVLGIKICAPAAEAFHMHGFYENWAIS
jgi:hypothetical protein